MIFSNAYITNEGSALLSRNAAGLGEIIWRQAATSSLDTNYKSDDQMREITTATFGTLTSLGSVKNSSSDSNIASIHCELNNRTYYGEAKTFGVWAKIEGDANEVLVIVARTGLYVTPTTINNIIYGLERAYVDISISFSDNQASYVSVVESYYAPAESLNEVNETISDLQIHAQKTYRDVWEALSLAKEDEIFGYLNKDVEIEIDEMDGDIFVANEVNPVWIQDGLFFFWYALARDYATPAHVVIASIDDLRKGKRVSLFNSTELLDWGFIEGGRCNPVYIDERYILYPMFDQYENSRYKYVSRTDFSLSLLDYGIVDYPSDLPSGLDLKRLQLSSAGNVAVYWNRDKTTWYVFGLKLRFEPPTGFRIESYDKIVSYTDPDDTSHPTELTAFGKVGKTYWAGDSFFFIDDGNAFYDVNDYSSNPIRISVNPIHKNGILFIGETDKYYLFSMTDLSYRKAKDLYATASSGTLGDCDGLFCPGFVASPYGVISLNERHLDYDTQFLFNNPTAICTDCSSYEYGGETRYRLKLAPKAGNFSKCTKIDGMIFPLL